MANLKENTQYSENHIVYKLIQYNKRFNEITGEASFFENFNTNKVASAELRVFYLTTISRIEVLENIIKCWNDISGDINFDIIQIELYTLRQQIKRFEI